MSDYAGEEVSPLAGLLEAFATSELPANNHSLALEASHVCLAGPGYLVSFTVSNTKASAQFVQFHDAQVVPANGAIPDVCFTLAATADKTVAYALPGRLFRRGIVVANSATAPTLTAGSADCFFDVQYLPIV